MSVSQSERSYIQDSLLADYRTDGRSRLDWRSLSIATDVAPQANGSARCRLAGTDVLAACRLEVEEASHGSLSVYVDCTPAALLALDNDISASIASHLATLFARSLQNHPQLSILPGRRAWQIILDLTVFAADGGNLLDASAAAARSALNNLRIPRTKPIGLSKEGGKASKSGIASLLKPGATSRVKGKQRATDFELESYYDEGVPLKGAEDLPVSVTLNLLGDIVFIDADLQEERCAPSRLLLGVDRKSRIRLVRQEGEMEVGIARLDGLIDQAAPMAAELIESLNAFQNPPGRA